MLTYTSQTLELSFFILPLLLPIPFRPPHLPLPIGWLVDRPSCCVPDGEVDVEMMKTRRLPHQIDWSLKIRSILILVSISMQYFPQTS